MELSPAKPRPLSTNKQTTQTSLVCCECVLHGLIPLFPCKAPTSLCSSYHLTVGKGFLIKIWHLFEGLFINTKSPPQKQHSSSKKLRLDFTWTPKGWTLSTPQRVSRKLLRRIQWKFNQTNLTSPSQVYQRPPASNPAPLEPAYAIPIRTQSEFVEATPVRPAATAAKDEDTVSESGEQVYGDLVPKHQQSVTRLS